MAWRSAGERQGSGGGSQPSIKVERLSRNREGGPSIALVGTGASGVAREEAADEPLVSEREGIEKWQVARVYPVGGLALGL